MSDQPQHARTFISTGSTFEDEIGYSRAVIQGGWCFMSGVTGYDYKTMTLPEGVSAQAENAFHTIFSVLAEAGFEPAQIARVQYTITNRAYLKDIQPILKQFMGHIRPAATMVVADLIEPGMKIEIEVTAYRGT